MYTSNSKKLQIKDLVTIGVFSAIYFATDQFTIVLLITFGISCILAEIIWKITGYNKFKGNLLSYAFFSLGMVGSPLPIWLFRKNFSEQILAQGMPVDYVSTMNSFTPIWVLIIKVLVKNLNVR